MKPHRVRMCHSLVTNYGLYKKMDVIVSMEAYCSYPRILRYALGSDPDRFVFFATI